LNRAEGVLNRRSEGETMKRLVETVFPYVAVLFIVLSLLSRVLFGADQRAANFTGTLNHGADFQQQIKCRVLCHW
jgi:hypothetical protein